MVATPRLLGGVAIVDVYVLSQIVNGLIFGLIYGLIALGLTIVFSIMRVVNFAHG